MQHFEKGTAYWVDNHSNVLTVPIGEVHADIATQKLGANVNPYQKRWVRVNVDGNYGVMFEYTVYPSPQQILSLRDIADVHGMPLFDTIKRQVLEHRRNSVIDALLQECRAQLVPA